MEEFYGVENSKTLHLNFEKEEHPYYPEGIHDNTHLSVKGAAAIARIVVKQIIKQGIPLRKKLKKTELDAL